jgi:hypothetical protein
MRDGGSWAVFCDYWNFWHVWTAETWFIPFLINRPLKILSVSIIAKSNYILFVGRKRGTKRLRLNIEQNEVLPVYSNSPSLVEPAFNVPRFKAFFYALFPTQ